MLALKHLCALKAQEATPMQTAQPLSDEHVWATQGAVPQQQGASEVAVACASLRLKLGQELVLLQPGSMVGACPARVLCADSYELSAASTCSACPELVMHTQRTGTDCGGMPYSS